MSDMFAQIPLEYSFIRNLQTTGGWATIVKDVNKYIEICPFKKLDVVYVYNEQMPGATLRKYQEEVDKFKLDKDEYLRAWEHLMDNFFVGGGDPTETIFDVSHDQPFILRFYSYELNLNTDIIKDKEIMVEAYDVIHFSAGNMSERESPPLIEEPLKDMIDSLRLDGMSEFEAIEHILNNGVLSKIEKKQITDSLQQKTMIVPQHYYQCKERLRKHFVR